MTPFAVRIYCMTCHEICPSQTVAGQEAWKAEHIRTRHEKTGPFDKPAVFAPVPKGWGR